MLASCPTLILVAHADAGDRNLWTDDQDLRPLSDLGRRQAANIAAGVGAVDGVFSSPARRCSETVAPIATTSGLEIVEMDDLRELPYAVEHRAWEPWGASMADFVLSATGVGRIMRAVTAVADRVPTGRTAVCAHGDLVPMFAAFAATALGVPLPDPVARGGWFEIDFLGPNAGVRAEGALLPKP